VLDLPGTRRNGSVRQLERLLEILADKRANLERQLEDIHIMQRELDQVEERCKGALGELKATKKSS
jgi:chaperonin cofactor prefoldin